MTTYPSSGGSYLERACAGCSFLVDQVAHPAHLNARATSLAFVSRAPQAEIRGLQQRMGTPTSVSRDQRLHPRRRPDLLHVLRRHRADEQLGTPWNYLDITALGRQEEWEDSPAGSPQTPAYQWWNYHDAYATEVAPS